MTGNVIEYISPPAFNLYGNFTICTISYETIGSSLLSLNFNAFNNVTAFTQNRLIFLPLFLTQPALVNMMFWVNGSVANGNTDVGVYDFAGTTKLVSTGSTANSGTATLQVVNVTDTILPANEYMWLALGTDSATQNYLFNNAPASCLDFIGVKQQLSGWSSGLPSSITLGTPTIAVTPVFGFTAKSVIV